MPIGIFDSGVGGATVLAEALRQMPEEDYIYFADTLHVPYGEKSKEAVREHIIDGVGKVLDEGIKALVIACNTATSIAAPELRSRYAIPIIGMEPAVKPAVIRQSAGEKRVLVFATSLTLKEAKFRQLVSQVDHRHIVDYMALPGLVELAERMVFDGPEAQAYLMQRLQQYNLSLYGTIVLGCTHFPLFTSVFRRLLPPDIDIIDGARGTVRHLRTILSQAGLSGGGRGRVSFRSSGNRPEDRIVFEAALRAAAVQNETKRQEDPGQSVGSQPD